MLTAYDEIKRTYALNTTTQTVMLKKEFINCKPKSRKMDPDVWFNELESLKMRLAVMGSRTMTCLRIYFLM